MKKSVYLFLFSSLLIINSCSITQRRYMPGHSVSWMQRNNNTSVHQALSTEINTSESKHKDSKDFNTQHPPLYASVEKNLSYNRKQNLAQTSLTDGKRSYSELSLQECDIIILKNGTEIEARVIEKNANEIVYKKCITSADDESFQTVNKSEVNQIKYASGIVEFINSEKENGTNYGNKNNEEQDYYSPNEKHKSAPNKNTPQHNTNYHKKLNPFSIASFASAIFSFVWIVLALLYSPYILILLPIPIILGIIALREIKENPDFFKGKGMAAFGIIFSGVITSIVLLVLLLILLLTIII